MAQPEHPLNPSLTDHDRKMQPILAAKGGIIHEMARTLHDIPLSLKVLFAPHGKIVTQDHVVGEGKVIPYLDGYAVSYVDTKMNARVLHWPNHLQDYTVIYDHQEITVHRNDPSA